MQAPDLRALHVLGLSKYQKWKRREEVLKTVPSIVQIGESFGGLEDVRRSESCSKNVKLHRIHRLLHFEAVEPCSYLIPKLRLQQVLRHLTESSSLVNGIKDSALALSVLVIVAEDC